MFIKIILAISLFFLNLELSYCQHAASATNPNSYSYPDTTKKIFPAKEVDFNVNVRLVAEKRIEEYKNDPDFNYNNEQPEPDDWISKIKNWIEEQLAGMNSSKTFSTIIDYLYYGLMFLALILIVRGLIGADRRGIIFGKINKEELKLVESEEEISSLNFDQLITSAIDSKNFKLAVRYLFLKSLQQLSENAIIELRNNKTNYQYLSEIKNNQIANVFQKTTSLFEWVWYGNFPVDDKILKSSRNEFNQLFEMLKA